MSPLFARACEIAFQAAKATGGLVDPTLGEAVEAAGYDRDFAELDRSSPPGPPRPGRWREVKLVDRMLFRPAGLRLELNGVVKGLAVDAAVELARRWLRVRRWGRRRPGRRGRRAPRRPFAAAPLGRDRDERLDQLAGGFAAASRSIT